MQGSFINKKLLAVVLSAQLALPLSAMAQAQPSAMATKKTEQEIHVMISKADKYAIELSPIAVALITAGVVGAGYAAVKLSYFVGDVKGFGRGYTSAQTDVSRRSESELAKMVTSLEEDLAISKIRSHHQMEIVQNKAELARQQGYKKGYKFGRKRGAVDTYKYISGDLKRPQSHLYMLIKEGGNEFSDEVMASIGKLARNVPGKDEVSLLLLKLSRQLEALKFVKANSLYGTPSLELAIQKTVSELALISKVHKPFVRSVVDQVVQEVGTKLKGKGGVAGMLLIGAFTAATLISCDSEANANLVSNNRAAVSLQLQQTLKTSPELLAATALVLKEQYGAQLVVSVLAEGQGEYFPIIANQFETINSVEIAELVADISTEVKSNAASTQLVNELKGKSWIESFSDAFKNSNGSAFKR